MITYDIAAFQPPTGTDTFYAAALATPMTSGRKITGMEKLGQRFLLELMTELGTLTFAPARGSPFMTLLHQSAMHEADIVNAFNIAMLTVTKNLQSEEAITDPVNERFYAATLNTISILGNGVIQMAVTVQNLSGVLGMLVFPVSLNTIPVNAIGSID